MIPLSVSLATAADVRALASLRTAVANDLTNKYGKGHWSAPVSERGAALALRHARVLLLHDGPMLTGTLRLANKKPWAIDKTYFTDVRHAIYLTDMAVDPARQRQGLGRRLVEEAIDVGARVAGECRSPRRVRFAGRRGAVLRQVRIQRSGARRLSRRTARVLRVRDPAGPAVASAKADRSITASSRECRRPRPADRRRRRRGPLR